MSETPQPLATPDLPLQFLLDASPVGMLIFNHREEIVFANPPAARLFSLTHQQRPTGRCGDAIRCANRLKTVKGCGHADTCPSCPLFRGLRATIAGTATPMDQEGETLLDREPGCPPLWIRYKIQPLIMNGARGAILTVDDITALHQSAHQYALLFREMLNAFALHEILCNDEGQPVDYRFLAVNPAFEKMTGLAAEQVIGRTVLEILPDTELFWIETYGRVALNGAPVRFEHFSREIDKFFSINAFSPIPGQFACLFEDITERERAREKLKKSEAKYRSAYSLLRSLCDNVPDMIWAKDLEKRYLFANAAICRDLLNAADTEEPIGKTDLFFAQRERSSHPGQEHWHTFGELCRDSDTATMEAGHPMQFDEFGNIRGQFLYLDVQKAPFCDEHGAMIGTVGSARDVTAVREMERQLRVREERLDLAIRGADLGTWDWHIPSGAIVINQRWAEMLGHTREELAPSFDSWMDLIHPDDRGRVHANLARHLAGETGQYETEYRLRHKSREWIWILDKGRIIERDPRGTPVRACGTHLDITRQKILIEQSRDGIVVLDSQGKVREANRHFARMLGYTVEEVHRLHVWDWDARWTPEQLLQAIDLVDASGDFFETSHRRKDGSIFPVEISSNGSMCSGEKLVFCICRDLTERKRAEESSKRNEALLHAILRNIPFDFWVRDPSQRIIMQSDHSVRFWGDLVKQPHLDWQFDPQTVSRWRQHYQRALAGDVVVEDYPLVTANGNQVELHKIVAPIRDGDKTLGIIGINIDITERKRMEKERSRLQAQLIHAQKMEAIGTLAGGIAHDFNNILGAVIGYAEMAREDCPPGSTIARDLDLVLEAGNRAANLVKQILAFSRQHESEALSLNPSLIVKEVVKLLRPSLPSTIAISHRLTATRNVFADPTQLHQMLMNLATNGYHAMEKAGGRLELTLEDAEYSESDLAPHPGIAPGPFVRFSVTDTGSGIPMEIKERIFDPYFTTKEVGKGTGMGLAIVDGIVRGLGGFITCESTPGEGTVFAISLPACDDDLTETGEAPVPLAAGGGHILLVDDEDILIEMGQAMLKRLGFAVTACTNSIEALTTFQNDPSRFDAVITDQTMPGMTGLDLARRMLQIRPDLPIILCTGYSNLINETQVKAFGIKGFAMKPLTKKEISALLREVMNCQE